MLTEQVISFQVSLTSSALSGLYWIFARGRSASPVLSWRRLLWILPSPKQQQERNSNSVWHIFSLRRCFGGRDCPEGIEVVALDDVVHCQITHHLQTLQGGWNSLKAFQSEKLETCLGRWMTRSLVFWNGVLCQGDVPHSSVDTNDFKKNDCELLSLHPETRKKVRDKQNVRHNLKWKRIRYTVHSSCPTECS